MDKWQNVFYSKGKTKENYKFPKILSKDNEYHSEVLKFIDILIEDLKINNIDEAFIDIAKEYRKIIDKVLKKYYSGEIVVAYNIIEKLIVEYKKSGIIFSKISKSYSFNYYIIENKNWEHFLFYRARFGDISNENKEDALKHTPYDMISKIGSNRFSIPGQPCLYLGSSSYDCWIEMGKPSDRDFNVGCILLNKDYELLNLATDTWILLGAIEGLKEQKEKESRTQICEEPCISSRTIQDWALIYNKHGLAGFSRKIRNGSYSNEFKMKVVEEYIRGEGSSIDYYETKTTG